MPSLPLSLLTISSRPFCLETELIKSGAMSRGSSLGSLEKSWPMQVHGTKLDECRDAETWLMSLSSCCLSSLKDHGDWGRTPIPSQRQLLHPSSQRVKRTSGELQPDQLHSGPWGNHGASNLEWYFGTHQKVVTRNHQHGLTEGKSCLTKLIVFYDEIRSVDL